MTDNRHSAVLDALRRGNLAEAESLCEAFLSAGGGGEGLYLMGAIQSMKGDKPAAERLMGRAAGLLPQRADIAYNHGVTLRETGNAAAAAAEWRRTLTLDIDHRDARANLALVLDEMGDPSAAAAMYGQLLERWPDDRDGLYNLGNLCQRAGETKVAQSVYGRLVEVHPGFVPGWINFGMLLKRVRDWSGAERCYRQAIAVDSGSAAAHFNLANLLLQRGQWRAGFAEYEWRLALPGEARPSFPYPEWTGHEPAGTRVLLWGDQGYGDTIQFLRFAEAITTRGHRVFAVVKTELRALVATMPGIDAVLGPEDAIPEADVQVSLASLPHRLGIERAGDLWRAPYMHASNRGPHLDGVGLKVGLVWAGDPRHPNDAHRSARLDDLAPLFEEPNLSWFSLQLGPARDQLAPSPWASRITDLAPHIDGFMASASLVQQLDMVVTVDTSMAHLVGALGKPGLVMLPATDCDWRWLDEGDATPWYPTLHLFRQTAPRDWPGVARLIAAALAAKAT
ncbi:MAG TPA: tetratricopeptide repeat-containing glycosyltransferase family protein [Magnetospirillaceae bacterium]|jgi:tetratricopeptide (TPR) repeat protein